MKLSNKILFGFLILASVGSIRAAQAPSGVKVINKSATVVGVVGMVQDPSKQSGYSRVTELGMALAPNSEVILPPSVSRVIIKRAPASVQNLGSANNLTPAHTVVINPDLTVTFPADVVAANAATIAANRTAYFAAQQGVGFAAAQDQATRSVAAAKEQANAAAVAQGGILSGSTIILKGPFGNFNLVIRRIQSATNAADDAIRIGDVVTLSDAEGFWSSRNPDALVKNSVSSGQNDEYFILRFRGEVPVPAPLLKSGDININFIAVNNAYLSHQPNGLIQINRYFIMNSTNYTSLIWEQFGIEKAK